MPTRISRTWEHRIRSGVLTKYQTVQFNNCLVPLAEGYAANGHRSALTAHEARGLREILWQQGGVTLTDEHTAQGIDWLRKNRRHFPDAAIDRFSHFTYQGDGYLIAESQWGNHARYMPVWRIHTTDGRLLDYAYTAWQSRLYTGLNAGLPAVTVLRAA